MIDRNREGWFRPIHKYPLGWSRLAAGSVPRVLFMLFFHASFVAMLWWTAPAGRFDYMIAPLIMFTVFFPGLYLYALFRLIKIIESGNNEGAA